MSKSSNGSRRRNPVRIPYQLIRNVTSPEEKGNGVQTYVANVPAYEIRQLDTSENLRNYIAAHNERKRNSVHRAIESTIREFPDRFINRNSGITISCSNIVVDDNAKHVDLFDASLINGAQTQGEIQRHANEIGDPETGIVAEDFFFHVRAEIYVDPDNGSVVETAIARNTATSVKSITQAGARGHLKDLQASIALAQDGAKIRKSEQDTEVLETLTILQLTRLLMPESVSGSKSAAEKLRAYKNKAQCLTDFSDWYTKKEFEQDAKDKYYFTVKIAPHAYAEAKHWESHANWTGHQIWEATKQGRAVRRDRSGNVNWVAPGILYPLLSGLSPFVVQDPLDGWVIRKPDLFQEPEMIRRAVAQFRAHNSDPMAMGRSEGAYDAMRIYPETLVEVLKAAGKS